MPPRKTNTSSTTSSTPHRQTRQSTLSFGRPTRVTKPTTSSTPPIAAKEALKKAAATESKPPQKRTISIDSSTDEAAPRTKKPELSAEVEESPLPTPAPSSPITAIEKPAIEKPTVETPTVSQTPDETAARKISKTNLQKYHKTAILNNRLLPPIHQEDLTLEEKILRHFDMSSQYGPFTGVSRVERWVRAKRLGLGPPIEVLAVALMTEDSDGGEEKGRDMRRAFVDEWFSTTARAV